MKRRPLSLIAIALLASGCTSIPPALQAPVGERHIATLQAAGRWVYHCRLSNDGTRQAWATLRPEAELHDAAGQNVGRLESGPNLVHRDGSVAELTLRERSDAPASLPWALYSARSAGTSGAFASTVSVQQIRTTGGAVPTEGCETGDQLMAERAVPFTADLRLFGR